MDVVAAVRSAPSPTSIGIDVREIATSVIGLRDTRQDQAVGIVGRDVGAARPHFPKLDVRTVMENNPIYCLDVPYSERILCLKIGDQYIIAGAAEEQVTCGHTRAEFDQINSD